MSRAVTIPILALALPLLLGGCGKSTTGPGPNDRPVFGPMSATVGGRAWSAVSVGGSPAAMGLVVESSPADRTLTLSGVREGRGDTLTSSLYVILTGPRSGAFDLGGETGNTGVWLLQHRADTLATTWTTDGAHTGTLSIATFDTLAQRVAGSFSFSAWDADSGQVEVTSGTFDVPFTTSRGPLVVARPGPPSRPAAGRALAPRMKRAVKPAPGQ